jgi:integrase
MVSAAELHGAVIENTPGRLREEVNDADLAQHVTGWRRWLTSRSRKPLADAQADDYLRQLRTLIPEAKIFRRSRLNGRAVNAWLESLPATSTSTRARYYAALRSFVRYLRMNALLAGNPLEAVEAPSNGVAREKYLTFSEMQRVLPAIADETARAVVALALGSGMERTALEALTVADVVDREKRIVRARGMKNEHRRRYVVVDQWAWPYLESHLAGKIGHAKVFDADFGRVLDDFYAAQLATGLVPSLPDGLSPTMARKTKGVSIKGRFHTLHDCRHSYAINRMIGADGEPKRNLQEIAEQLGHKDLQMVSRVYARHKTRFQQEAAERYGAQGAHSQDTVARA